VWWTPECLGTMVSGGGRSAGTLCVLCPSEFRRRDGRVVRLIRSGHDGAGTHDGAARIHDGPRTHPGRGITTCPTGEGWCTSSRPGRLLRRIRLGRGPGIPCARTGHSTPLEMRSETTQDEPGLVHQSAEGCSIYVFSRWDSECVQAGRQSDPRPARFGHCFE